MKKIQAFLFCLVDFKFVNVNTLLQPKRYSKTFSLSGRYYSYSIHFLLLANYLL